MQKGCSYWKKKETGHKPNQDQIKDFHIALEVTKNRMTCRKKSQKVKVLFLVQAETRKLAGGKQQIF